MSLVNIKFLSILIILTVLNLATTGYIIYSSGFELTEFQVSSSLKASKPITFPYMVGADGAKDYTYSGVINRGRLGAYSIQVTPDNKLMAIEINGHAIDLSHFSVKELSDLYYGMTVDLSDYIVSGGNTLVIKLEDYGGNTGLNIQPRPNFIARFLLLLSLLILSVLIAILVSFWHYKNTSPDSTLKSVLKGAIQYLTRGICAYSASMPKWRLALIIVAYTIIVCSNAYTVYFIFDVNPLSHIWSDPARHWVQGIDALRLDPMQMTDPVLYQLYIGIIAKLSLKLPALVAYYTSCLALVGTWIWYKFFRELQHSKLVALVGWAFLSALPSWTSIYAYFMQETLLIPMLGAALYSTWRCKRKGTVASFYLMVFVWILAGLTRGICIPLAAVSCTWLWFEQDKKITKGLCSALVLLLVMGPLVYRSYSIVGIFAPHGIGHLSFLYAKSGNRDIQIHYKRKGAEWTYGFSNPSMGLKPFSPLSDWTSERKGLAKVFINLDNGKADWDTAHERYKLTLEKYLWITKENFFYIFFAPSWPDSNRARIIENANYVTRWLWAPATIIALIWTIWVYRQTKGSRLLFALIGIWFMVQVILPISVNEGRYRKPFEGLLVAQYMLLISATITARRRKVEGGSGSARSRYSGMFKHSVLVARANETEEHRNVRNFQRRRNS